MPVTNGKSLESWIWDAACSIRGAKDAPKYKDFILPLIFTKRLCDVFDDEVNRIAAEVGSRTKAFQLAKLDWHKAKDKKKAMVRFYIPLVPADANEPVWSVIRKLSDKIGEQLTTHLREIAKENPLLSGIIDRIDFNATTHGQRDLDDDRLSNLIEAISTKRLGLDDVEPDIIGKSYEYLIRKFAEGSGQSAGEFYTPPEVGMIIAKVMDAEPGMEIYDPCCGSGGLLIKCEIAMEEKMNLGSKKKYAPLKLYGQEYTADTWAMANMNMIIHDMEGEIEIGDTFKNPKFRKQGKLRTFDRVVANPMWNQDWFIEADYDNDELGRFPEGAGYPGSKADWGWIQHIISSLNDKGKAAVILGVGSATRGSGEAKKGPERQVRKYFIEKDMVEAVILLPFNLFYNTDAPGVLYIFNKNKQEERKKKIMFINASREFIKEKPKNLLTDKAVNEITNIYLKYNEIEGVSRIVPLDQVVAKDYYLTPSRYVFKRIKLKGRKAKDIFIEYESTLEKIETIKKFIATTYKQANKRNQLETKDTVFGKLIKGCDLLSLDEIVSEFNKKCKSQELPVFSCSKIYGIILQKEKFNDNIASSNLSNYKMVAPNMFAYDPMLLWDGSIGMNKYNFTGVVSPAYTVFKVIEENIDLNFLEFVLRSKIMIPFYISISDGTNMRRRKAKFHDFKTIMVPYPKKENRDLISSIINAEENYMAGMQKLNELKNAIFREAILGK